MNRLIAAHQRCLEAATVLQQRRSVRDQLIRALRANGISRYKIAKAIGMTPRGVKLIEESHAKPNSILD